MVAVGGRAGGRGRGGGGVEVGEGEVGEGWSGSITEKPRLNRMRNPSGDGGGIGGYSDLSFMLSFFCLFLLCSRPCGCSDSLHKLSAFHISTQRL